ncbi:MAG: SET domain-containing protein-lysine N-methyltransferase [Candidatus Pacebacteria bacterium]|nr:SET domain-containing protein-lysine N-methyltransferase [Candidatus Paceibacterota bacterium]
MSKRGSKYQVGDFKLQVKRSKTGKGLFANTAIPRGACIIEYTGRVVSEAKQARMSGKYLFEVSKKVTIDGNIPSNKARYINHSCAPNCEADGPSGKVFILALRNIKPGEELTYDYGEEYFDEHIKPKGCRCPKCTAKRSAKNRT